MGVFREYILHLCPESVHRWFSHTQERQNSFGALAKYQVTISFFFFNKHPEGFEPHKTNKTCHSQMSNLLCPMEFGPSLKLHWQRRHITKKSTPGLGRCSSKAIKLLSKTIITDVKMRVSFFVF